MTAFSFTFGTGPLAMASGAGAVAKQILGTAVIGGMLAATLLAIFIIPVTYYAMEHLKDRCVPRKSES
jgi:HAE1 family hydrophobic/amphiphilic exporter-1